MGILEIMTAPTTEEALRRAAAHRNQGRLDGVARALEDLRAAKEEADAKLARAESTIMELRQQVEDLRADAAMVDAAYEPAIADLERLQIHCEALERENQALRADVSSLSDREMRASMYAAYQRREARESEKQARLEAQREWDAIADKVLTDWVTPNLGVGILEREFFDEATNLLREADLSDVRNSDVWRWLRARTIYRRDRMGRRRVITVDVVKEK